MSERAIRFSYIAPICRTRISAAQMVRACARSLWENTEVTRQECKARGIEAIVGGCPLTYCEPVVASHRCIRSWLRLFGRVPG